MGTVTKLHGSPLGDAVEYLGDGVAECIVLAWSEDGELTIYDSGMELSRMCLAAQVLDAKCKREAGQMLSPDDIEYQ